MFLALPNSRVAICPRSSCAVPRDWAYQRVVNRDLRSLVKKEAVCQYFDAAGIRQRYIKIHVAEEEFVGHRFRGTLARPPAPESRRAGPTHPTRLLWGRPCDGHPRRRGPCRNGSVVGRDVRAPEGIGAIGRACTHSACGTRRQRPMVGLEVGGRLTAETVAFPRLLADARARAAPRRACDPLRAKLASTDARVCWWWRRSARTPAATQTPLPPAPPTNIT